MYYMYALSFSVPHSDLIDLGWSVPTPLNVCLTKWAAKFKKTYLPRAPLWKYACTYLGWEYLPTQQPSKSPGCNVSGSDNLFPAQVLHIFNRECSISSNIPHCASYYGRKWYILYSITITYPQDLQELVGLQNYGKIFWRNFFGCYEYQNSSLKTWSTFSRART